MGVHLYPLTDLVQDPKEYVKVRVAQPHPGVGHVACLYGLRRRAKGRKVITDIRSPYLRNISSAPS